MRLMVLHRVYTVSINTNNLEGVLQIFTISNKFNKNKLLSKLLLYLYCLALFLSLFGRTGLLIHTSDSSSFDTA